MKGVLVEFEKFIGDELLDKKIGSGSLGHVFIEHIFYFFELDEILALSATNKTWLEFMKYMRQSDQMYCEDIIRMSSTIESKALGVYYNIGEGREGEDLGFYIADLLEIARRWGSYYDVLRWNKKTKFPYHHQDPNYDKNFELTITIASNLYEFAPIFNAWWFIPENINDIFIDLC